MFSNPDNWLWPLFGGALIGLSAAIFMLLHGRVAGISGIVGSLATGTAAPGDRAWRAQFFVGLVAGGLAMLLLRPEQFVFELDRSLPALAVAGLLVGFGTRLGNGCTSGHGVCGIARFSRRSLVATITFILTGILAVWVVNGFFGGAV
jgi:uncharacterized membrane protein YedE/YeeE